ncbi:MAG: response regulator transcription factor [Gemmatimonadota bacterium]|nr:response regulator transcription factor [Gemmatimonadota bacterium]
MEKKTRVLVADDHKFFRVLLRKLLESIGCEVVGEATDGLEALDLFALKKPDVMLLDIEMPNKNGFEVLKQIKGSYPDARIIMLTSVADLEMVKKCIGNGASNYLLKDISREVLKTALIKSIIETEKEKKESLNDDSGDSKPEPGILKV